jgi:hypothetical protein
MWIIVLLIVIIVSLFLVAFKPKAETFVRSRTVVLVFIMVFLLAIIVWVFVPKY